MKKRIFSLLLAICLVAGLLPTIAYAEGDTSHEGWTELTKDILESTYKVESLGTYKYVLPSGHYYLGDNISVDKKIDIGDSRAVNNVILDLNGYELRKDDNTALLYLQYDSTLTIMDSSENKTGKIVSDYAICFSNKSKLNANGGTIEGDVYIFGDNVAIDNTDHSNVTVFRNGQIGGTYATAIINDGIFYSTVDNYHGTIAGGTFYGEVTNINLTTGGTFYGEVTNNGAIKGGIFTGTVSGSGTIKDSAKVTVTFISDGGNSVDEQKVLRGQKASAPTAPTKAGYSFEGWYKGDTEFDFANTPVIENTTLSAKWTPKTYHVTLNTNGADSCAELVGYTYGIGATLPTPVKEGYTFAGWYTANDFSGDAVTSISTTDTDDKTFYAKWVEKSNISFNTATQSYTYDGSAQAFSIIGTSVTGFNISYQQNGQTVTNPTDAGSYDVIVTRAADDTYKAVNETISNGLVINPKAVTATISAIPDETYTGSNIEPAVTVYDGDTVISASEYTISYSNNKNVGTATVTLADKTGGNYNVSGTTTFEILPKSIEDAVLTLDGNLTYDGTEQTQNVSVTLAGFDAVTFDVSNNKQTNVNTNGDYTLTVTGNGNFTGTKNFNWNIASVTPTENSAKKTTARVIKGKALSDATITNGEIFAIDNTTLLTGTFAWVDSTKVMNTDGTEQMVFTPDNTNYTPITIDVAVSTYTTGGGSGGGGYSTYQVNVENTKNGTVTMNPKSASAGTIVTLTVTPDKGYTLETLKAFTSNNKEIKITEKDDKYTFVMPASKVTVKATFMEDNTMLNFFVDIPVDAYYYDAVLWAVENGITSGTDAVHFSPNAPCTRAQIITFLWRAAGSPEPKTMSNFADVAVDTYYAKAVSWAVENGITTGTGDGKFSPNDTCTRAQAMTFIYRSEQADNRGLTGEWMFQNPFSDVNIENYYGKAVVWAIANGVTSGTTVNTFSPNNDCTRAQIITFLYRFYRSIQNS